MLYWYRQVNNHLSTIFKDQYQTNILFPLPLFHFSIRRSLSAGSVNPSFFTPSSFNVDFDFAMNAIQINIVSGNSFENCNVCLFFMWNHSRFEFVRVLVLVLEFASDIRCLVYKYICVLDREKANQNWLQFSVLWQLSFCFFFFVFSHRLK